MLIGQLVDKSGLTRDTIRYYERRGLIETPSRRDNNYKEYAEDSLQRLVFVKRMQMVGFTLAQTGELLELYLAGEGSCGNVGLRLREHLQEIDERIAELEGMRTTLRETFEVCRGSIQSETCAGLEAAFRSS